MGRPKKLEPPAPFASAKITPQALEAAKMAAPLEGLSVQEFISRATIAASEKVLDDFAKKRAAAGSKAKAKGE
jgi:uncharacterized protein (DUF1778 family)